MFANGTRAVTQCDEIIRASVWHIVRLGKDIPAHILVGRIWLAAPYQRSKCGTAMRQAKAEIITAAVYQTPG